MGCGCSKGKANTATATVSRTTVYEVIDESGTVLSSFRTLPEARAEAINRSARVRVSSAPLA